MIVHNYLISYFVICIITCVRIILSEEYYIKDGEVPSYLYHNFYNIKGDLFPEDISINVSLSSAKGTLLYSLDKNMNQLIVSLRDALPHIIDIELNKQKFSVFLSSLCGCERCVYEILELRIQLNTYINIQCNGGTIQNVLKQNRAELNDAYPIWQPDIISNVSQYNNTMCIVNTPEYDTIYPNPAQMSGCIFQVSYNEQPINFSNVTSNIKQKCNESCADNICNGGQCYESYSDAPICNCTATFLNGRFCNATKIKQNRYIFNQNWQIDMFKVSWKSSVDNIFEIKNTQISLVLIHEKEESTLYFEYKSTKMKRTHIKAVLTEDYLPNTEYICIVYFHKRNIDVRLLSNGSWSNVLVPLNGDLRKETFNSITLRSGDDGYIDMVYMDEQEYKWRKLYIGNYTDLVYDDLKTQRTNISVSGIDQGLTITEGDRKTVISVAVIVIFVVLCAVLGISLIIVWRRVKTARYMSIPDDSIKTKQLV